MLELDLHRERAAAVAAALGPKAKPRKRAEGKPLTQAEVMAEAAATEVANTASLARLLATEEDSKRRAAAAAKKPHRTCPASVFRSRDGVQTLAFIRGAAPRLGWADGAGGPPEAPMPGRRVCAATGRTAHYLDPSTNLPFCDAAAFTALREAASRGQDALEALPFYACAIQPHKWKKHRRRGGSLRPPSEAPPERGGGGGEGGAAAPSGGVAGAFAAA